ncbi:Uncharacterized protein TCAP_04415 [Tolypocladium capitatum]|uniref:Zinc finger protein n=1 Tax=Tolypocladium capitatum TaxID=45235 RepID=A0A2K3QDN6_9HYPO|nr:Uncharacterized protein TCAP_04415 [Tolypocladium capitatum]
MSNVSQCRICDRGFGRAEHRDRHLASHNALRPYRCNFCDHQFQRTDSLRRHVDRYCSNLHGANASEQNPSRFRVRSACDLCHSKKLKCDGNRPCRKCVMKQQDCTYQRQERFRLPPAPESPISPMDCRDPAHIETALMDNLPAPAVEEAPFAVPDSQSNMDPASSTLHQATLQGWVGGMHMSPDIHPMGTPRMELSCPDTTMDSIYDSSSSLDFPDPLTWMSNTFLPGLGDEYFAFDDPMLVPPQDPSHHEDHLSHLVDVLDLKDPSSQVDEQTVRWLQMPFVPRKYDLDMLNALLKVFARHVSGTFSSFQDFEITAHTLPEQILSMAAVGSLFVNLKGGSRISRMLFTDCNRMLNNSVFSFGKRSRQASMSLVQAFLASELFGICGGHPRSRELSEAYHHTIIQVVPSLGPCFQSKATHQDAQTLYMHGLLSEDNVTGDDKVQQERLLADIFLLESYRTSLFQLKPILTPAYLAHTKLGVGDSSDNPSTQLFNYVEQQASHLMTPDPSKPTTALSIGNLVLISIGSWLASGQWAESSYEANNRDWEPSVIHNAIGPMLRGNHPHIQVSTLLLSHMIIVALHAPLTGISDAAYSTAMQRKPTTAVIETIRSWRRSFDLSMALQHALQIIDVTTKTILSVDRTISGDKANYIEAPHDALCIFNAALVVWASKGARVTQTSGPDSASISHLGQAVFALLRMRLVVARSLSKVLQTISKVEGLN